jgi:hypothetical protein
VTLENEGAKILNRRGKEIQRKNLELAIESCMNLVHCNQQKTLHHKSPHRTPRKDKSEEEDGGGSEEEVRSRRKSKRRPAIAAEGLV